MYQIRYKDPMTGMILEAQSESLTEAVEAIKKAKDDLYYRGHSLPKEEDIKSIDPQSQAAEETAPPQTDDYDYDSDKQDDSSYSDYWYPYGVVLW